MGNVTLTSFDFNPLKVNNLNLCIKQRKRLGFAALRHSSSKNENLLLIETVVSGDHMLNISSESAEIHLVLPVSTF